MTRQATGLLTSKKRAKPAWVNRRRVHDYPQRRKAPKAVHDALYHRLEGELPPAVVRTAADAEPVNPHLSPRRRG